jgi:hypothetical protein
MRIERSFSNTHSRLRPPRFGPAAVRPLVAGIIAFFLFAGANAKAPTPAADQARLWIILILESDLRGGLNSDRVRTLYNSFPHLEAVLKAGKSTDVTVTANFLRTLKGVLEQAEAEKPGTDQFRVLFAFQWAAKPKLAELSHSKDLLFTNHPPHPLQLGSSEGWVHDRVEALDPTRGLQWRLSMNKSTGKRFDFTLRRASP